MSKVFLNGAITEADEARLSPYDRGLLLGDGLFETLRSFAGSLFRAEDHLARLSTGAEVLGIPLPLSEDAVLEALGATLSANGLEAKDAVLRLTLTRGPGLRGVAPPLGPKPTLLITAEPAAGAPLEPAKVCIAKRVRRNEHSPLSRLKTLNYLDSVLARREATERGADDALLLNTAGRLTGATSANLFAVIDGALLTPPVAEGVLPGIVRQTILELAAGLGIELGEVPIAPQDLSRAGEAFLTNSVIGIRPLAEVQGGTLDAPGPITRRLQAALAEALP